MTTPCITKITLSRASMTVPELDGRKNVGLVLCAVRDNPIAPYSELVLDYAEWNANYARDYNLPDGQEDSDVAAALDSRFTAKEIEALRAYFKGHGLEVQTWDEREFPCRWDYTLSPLIDPAGDDLQQFNLHDRDDWPLKIGVVGCYSRSNHDAALDAP
jgi:hypothetical protein